MNCFAILFCALSACLLSTGIVLAVQPQATRLETISGVGTEESSVYTAAKISVARTNDATFRSFRFAPASGAIEERVLVPASSNRTRVTVVPTQHMKVASIPEDALRNFPDWSVWADRSVLVVTIIHLSLTRLGTTCPKMSICAIPDVAPLDAYAMDITKTNCRSLFGEFSGTCHDNFFGEKSHSILFPLASSINVMVNPVGLTPPTPNSSLDFIVSAGYRLPPGVFRCPAGLFPCPLTTHRLKEYPLSSVDWQQRICLPSSLCCDGVPNCPESDFDEMNCDQPCFARANSFPPIAGEKEKVDEYLRQFNCDILRWIGHDCVLSATTTVYMLVALGALAFLCVLVATVLYIIRKSRMAAQSFRIQEKSVELRPPSRCSSADSMEKQKEFMLPHDKQNSDHETLTTGYLLDGVERTDFRMLS
ncbi:unnamed protein product [Dicrocoelium dendriticum]|nr:unnamed protein product [Dicrocoelium dendriticum]